MANKKISAFVSNPTRSSLDTLTGLDVSASAANQNAFWSLNTLFSVITDNTTDGAIRFGGVTAPAVSAAGQGWLYFDSGSNTLKLSQNTGAYADVRSGTVTVPQGGTGLTTLTAYALMAAGTTATGNMQQVSGVGTSGQVLTSNGAGALPTWQAAASGTIGGSIAANQVAVGSGVNTVAGSSALTFDTTTGAFTLGTSAVPGGLRFVGTGGNYINVASNSPSANRTLFLPDAAPATGNLLYISTGTTQSAWSTGLTWSSSAVLAISGTTNPGITVTGSAATESGITINQSVSGAAADAFHSFQTPSTTVVWRLTTAGFTPTGLVKANQLDTLGATGTVEMLWRLADASTRFVYGVNNVEAASINATSTLGLVLGAASTLTGRVKMFNSAGTTSTQISAGNAGSSLNFIWPVVNPTAGQVMSASAPSGSDVTLSWITPSAGASLTSTQVGFGSGANALTGSADLTYTDATGVFDMTKTLNSSVRYTVTNSNTGNAAQARFGASADTVGASLAAYSSTFTTSGLIIANTALLDLDSPVALIKAQTGGNLTIGLGNTSRVALTDNQLAVTTAPTTGAGFAVSAATVTTGNLVSFAASGTVAASNTKNCLAVSTSGANGTASQTTFGATISNTSTGTTNTNIALQLTASGAATANTALNIAAGALLTAGTITQTSASATAFTSGPNGATNPTFLLVNNTASAATGISITGAAAGGGVTLSVISSGANELLNLQSLGSGYVSIPKPSIGATSADGLVLVNTISAAAGAQQYSPRLRWTGQGWKTTATAASQTVDWAAEVQPVQGTTSPSANLVLSTQINAGGFSSKFIFTSDGFLAWDGLTTNTPMLKRNGATSTLWLRNGSDTGPASFIAQDYFGGNSSNPFIAAMGTSPNGVRVVSGAQYGWSSSATDATVASDTILSRNAAGVIKALGASSADGQIIANGALQSEGLYATVAGVDLNVTTKTTLYTVPAGKSLVITKVVIRNVSASLTTASFGVGFNANADDVTASALHTELTGNTLYTILNPIAGAKLGAAADVFGLKCSIAQGGAATATVDVYGYQV